MTKADIYRTDLQALTDWDDYLLRHSGLPGPRGNLELAQVAAEMASDARSAHWRSFDAQHAPTNSPQEFLAFCGTVALGPQLARAKNAASRSRQLQLLRAAASDPRWRTREAVAMALQRWGDADLDALIDALEQWREGNLYEQRAIAAALCEPRLLTERSHVKRVLKLLDGITRDFAKSQERKSDEFIVLKKGLAYCWSVAVAASPTDGKRAMEKWIKSDNPDVRAVMRENLKKNRLARMDKAWVQEQSKHVA